MKVKQVHKSFCVHMEKTVGWDREEEKAQYQRDKKSRLKKEIERGAGKKLVSRVGKDRE